MAKIHYSLVGGQPAPVYYGIKHYNPDKVFLIHSQQSERTAERIKSVIDYDVEMLELDPQNLEQNRKKIKEWSKMLEGDEVTVNISSGTKPWTFYFILYFGTQPHVTLFYIDQNNVLWNLKNLSSEQLDIETNIQFQLVGNEIKKYATIDEDYTPEDINIIPEIEEVRKFDIRIFNDLVKGEYSHKPKDNLLEKSHLKWSNNYLSSTFLMTKKNGYSQEFTLSSPNLKKLLYNAHWFELKVANILNKWKHCKELRMNCHFHFDTKDTKNEVDIIVNAGIKLLFVECKLTINQGTDVDKFYSVVRNFGGMGSKAILITDAPLRETIKEKCKEYNILSFSMQESYGGFFADRGLYTLLDFSLFNINPR